MFEKYSKIRPGVFQEGRVNECSNVFESSASLFARSTPDALDASGEERAQGMGCPKLGYPNQPGASDALT